MYIVFQLNPTGSCFYWSSGDSRSGISNVMAIAAYNHEGQKIGYVSAKSSYNKKVYQKMKQPDFIGKVWSIGKNQVLVEIDF